MNLRHALTLTVACAGATHAQTASYPVRPIRMVIPYSAGGATDVPARLIAAKLSDTLGHQVIIDNRPGAGSAIGSEIVARAQPLQSSLWDHRQHIGHDTVTPCVPQQGLAQTQ